MTISEQRPSAADRHRRRHILNELHFLVSRETATTGDAEPATGAGAAARS